jgi:2-polyprenyl-3-methyl-5-hydroxy-6-metoxy-1,4-benzoquinol methylase
MIERFNAKASTKGLANMIGITADVLHTDALVAQLSQRQLPHQYDLVISLMTPHHLDNIEAVTAALSKLLKPAGSIVFVDILKTDTSRLFHGHHAHHTVAHLGGFDKQYTACTRVLG